MSLFIEKYQPKSLTQFVGNKKILPEIINWFENPTTKMCLIHGPTGIGKTLCVQLISKQLNIQTYYVDNSQENIDINILKSFNRTNSITKNKNFIIIEEIDTISSSILDEIVSEINNIKIPIVCISNTNYIPPLKNITNNITSFRMFSPYDNEIYNFLYPILRENKINLKQDELNDIIKNCNNDIRYILNTLEMMKYGDLTCTGIKDNTSLNMFDVSKLLFDMDKTIEEKYNLFFLEYSMMPLFIQENYINNTFNVKDITKKMENISNSSQFISNGDLFDRMLHENNDWDLEKYIAICDIEATNKCNTKIVQFPEYFKKNKKQFSSYENSLKNINYYYPINTNIDKLSVDKKQTKKQIKKSETKIKNIKNKNNSSNILQSDKKEIITEEPVKLKLLPKKINKKNNIQETTIQETTIQETTIQETTIQETTIQETTIQETTIQETNIQETNIQNTKINKKSIIEQQPILEIKPKKKLTLMKVNNQENENIIHDNDTITCECGTIIKKSSKSSHLKSKKHLELLQNKK